MGGQDQLGLFRDKEVFARIDAIFLQALDLLTQNYRIQHHAITNNIDDVLTENA